MTKYITFLFLFLLFTGCKKECYHPKGEFFKYVIKKDSHYSSSRVFKKMRCDSLRFNFYFDNSVLEYGPDQINKIYGISNTIDHSYSSARLGWICKDSSNIEIYAYVRDMGTIRTKLLTVIKPHEIVKAEIVDGGSNWFISVDTDRYYEKVAIFKKYTTFYNFVLYPYYGGHDKAQQTINVYIDK